MRHSLFILLIAYLVFPTTLFAQDINGNTFLAEQSYPYELLQRKTDAVRVHYEDLDDEGFRCWTSIIIDEVTLNTETVQIEREEFVEDALKACLPRSDAKIILSNLYSGEFEKLALGAKN
ncbi:MAG: hypothetical protein AAGJ37_17505 [Pseudomonadota bacterium]